MRKDNIILGINWEQNSTAALMINGKIVGCCSEERFSNYKNDERYPLNAINFLLKEHSINKKNINKVSVISKNWSPDYMLTRRYSTFAVHDYKKEQDLYWYKKIILKKHLNFLKVFRKKIDFNQYPGKKFWKKNLNIKNNFNSQDYGKILRAKVIKKHLEVDYKLIDFIDHSSGHLYYAFFSNKNLRSKEKMVISLEAFGDNNNYRAAKFQIKSRNFHKKNIVEGKDFIIGRLYRSITLILGFKPNEHEYKIMGLAPYGQIKYFKHILDKFKNVQLIKNKKFHYKNKPEDQYFFFKNILDGNRFDNISAALQKYTEDLISSWVNKLSNKKFEICLAGGVGMNVKNNLILSKLKKVKNIYIPPSPDDSSQAMGACYYTFVHSNKKFIQPLPLKDAYLGYEIKNENIQSMLNKIDKSKYKVHSKNIHKKAANILFKGNIVGRCAGKAEFGARALGNRSILCDPSNLLVKEKLNNTVKNRDFWMPFAATIHSDYAKKYLNLTTQVENYEYMTLCSETTLLGRKKLKAAIHPNDKTCRPQILQKNTNKQYEKLLIEFGKISGIYALLNTSFNQHGYPIVNNEKTAFKIFSNTPMKALILNDVLIEKK